MVSRDYLARVKKVAEQNIRNLSNNSNVKLMTGATNSNTTMAQLYVDTQLLGAKSLGWFMSATLPVSYVFMKNANIINNSLDGIQTSSQGEAVTTILLNKATDLYSSPNSEDESVHQQTLDTEFLSIMGMGGTWVKNALATLTGYQVYLVMPFFN